MVGNTPGTSQRNRPKMPDMWVILILILLPVVANCVCAFLQWFNVASVLYGVFIMFTKLSVLWLYRRVFSPMKWSPMDTVIVALIVIMIGFYISTTIVKILECIPRARIFDKSIPGHCVKFVSTRNNCLGYGANNFTVSRLFLTPVACSIQSPTTLFFFCPCTLPGNCN